MSNNTTTATARPIVFPRIDATWKLREMADEIGSPYFAPETMRFFSSRLSSHIRPLSDFSGYFVTSERAPFDGSARRYSVRSFRAYWDTDEFGGPVPRVTFGTVGEFQEHATMRAAVKAMHAAPDTL